MNSRSSLLMRDAGMVAGLGGHGAVARRPSEPVLRPPLKVLSPVREEFPGGRLRPQWRWLARRQEKWFSLAARPGRLRLYPQRARLSIRQQPNLLLRRAPSRGFTVETCLDFFPCQWSEEAGRVLTGPTHVALALRHDGLRNTVVLRLNDTLKIIAPAAGGTTRLRLRVADDGVCSFEVGTAGRVMSIADRPCIQRGDGRGVRAGLYAIKQLENYYSGYADFGGFEFG